MATKTYVDIYTDYTDRVAEEVRRYAESWQSLWESLPVWPTGRRTTDCGCAHGHCGCEPCDCCTPRDADLVVRMRIGERRIVPVVVVNEWRRERTVTVGLSEWTGCPGDPAASVTGAVLPRGELTLGPCERRELIVELAAQPADKTGTADKARRPVEGVLTDIRVCATYCAELTVEGCSHKPVRLAAQVLPRTCDEYEIDCRCDCC
ncbi:MAG: hypothetical protein ACJ735_12930 [Actinomycetes bacterium]